jgi:hypothetical protein
LLWVYANDRLEQVAVSWRIRLSSNAAAQAVVRAAAAIPTLRARHDGRVALIVASSPELADWRAATDCD